MKKILIVLSLVLVLFSCKKERIYPQPCNGDCDASFEVIYKNLPIPKSSDGYYRIKWDGLNYFQVKGELSTLNEQYVINKVPLIETRYDSDYWILIDTLRFTTPMYSYLGWFNDRGYNNPISIGNFTGSMVDISKSHSPLNIVGYSIPKYFCFECAYAPTLIGTHSKYTYKPKQNIVLDNEMVGDTITIFTQTLFNSDIGEREIVEKNFKIIVE
jgi:hypothetical protein